MGKKLQVLDNSLRVVINALSFHGIFALNEIVISLLVGLGSERYFLTRTISDGCATFLVGLIEGLNMRRLKQKTIKIFYVFITANLLLPVLEVYLDYRKMSCQHLFYG